MQQSLLVVSLLVAAASAFSPSCSRPLVRHTALSAEWKPPSGDKWDDKNFEGELKKLEKEAEERLDAKIAELMSKIETTGVKGA